ncbi:ferric-dicitrate binding protein FerR (iron transport regulator) [Pedobacter sp. AK017]|uniref:FecR family protein n=1 Tax=Pedobacter sp. AK017 TaxID=2723073 RepID=UPI001615F5C6|nr:FecR domain-containing protein [Pedobacter sp. AK017]MBB5439661.1 ferric-dicitrate binding protein FerR (iron transport regulator) [Pedobacter sp. AK017]
MQEEEIQDLVYKYLNDTATLQEKEQLLNWYRAATPGEDVEWLASVKNEEQLLKASMLKYIKNQAGIEPAAPAPKLWPRLAIAAAAVAAIVFGLFFFKAPTNPKPGLGATNYTNDIAPGKNTATLTLANGKVIHLDTNRTSVVVTDSVSTTTMLTAATPLGGMYQITLPDGSRVWLNADSKISFPSQFTGEERKILMLYGEAYFEVKKDKKHPFIVSTGMQNVEVLGTHFNISAYKEDQVMKTTLLEGAVKISFFPPGGNVTTKERLLKPNQQAEIRGDQLTIKDVNATDAIAWKNGDFVFKGETIENIMFKVARWYNIEVIYAPDAPKDLYLEGVVSRSKNISAVLDLMQTTGSIHFKVEGRQVYVSR